MAGASIAKIFFMTYLPLGCIRSSYYGYLVVVVILDFYFGDVVKEILFLMIADEIETCNMPHRILKWLR